MKSKKSSVVISLLFSAVLVGMMLLTFLLPEKTFSTEEKRYLESMPILSVRSLVTGEFTDGVEAYISDHLPLRLQLVGLNAEFDRLMGRQTTKNIYISPDGRLSERPNTLSAVEDAIPKKLKALSAFADTIGRDIDLMIIPSAGFICGEDRSGLYDPYEDDVLIDKIYSSCPDNIKTFDAVSLLQGSDTSALYYYTDHHFTSRGAWLTASAYASGKGFRTIAESAYSIESVDGFRGSTYSRAGFWGHKSESIELWHSGNSFSVKSGNEQRDSIFSYENLDSGDMYTVFLGGNHPLVEITNKNVSNGRSLLVIRDSYSNCMGGFLADYYENVTLVDPRYYKDSISRLCMENEYDDILVEYSIGNFVTDNNIRRIE